MMLGRQKVVTFYRQIWGDLTDGIEEVGEEEFT